MGISNKSDIEYLFNHGQVNNYGIELSCTTGRKLLRDVTMRPLVILKQLQRSMAVMGANSGWINNIVVNPQ
jgi:hypothetical protein